MHQCANCGCIVRAADADVKIGSDQSVHREGRGRPRIGTLCAGCPLDKYHNGYCTSADKVRHYCAGCRQQYMLCTGKVFRCADCIVLSAYVSDVARLAGDATSSLTHWFDEMEMRWRSRLHVLRLPLEERALNTVVEFLMGSRPTVPANDAVAVRLNCLAGVDRTLFQLDDAAHPHSASIGLQTLSTLHRNQRFHVYAHLILPTQKV